MQLSYIFHNNIIDIKTKEKEWVKILRLKMLKSIHNDTTNILYNNTSSFYSSNWKNPAIIECYSYLNNYTYMKFPYKLCSWLIHQKRKSTIHVHFDSVYTQNHEYYKNIKDIDICLARLRHVHHKLYKKDIQHKCYHCLSKTNSKISDILYCCVSCERNYWIWIEFYKCWKFGKNKLMKLLNKDVVKYIIKNKILNL